MAVISFGKANLVQANMLILAGYLPEDSVGSGQIDEQRQVALMKKARCNLTKFADCDFAYDIHEWHEYLQKQDKLKERYTSGPAWKYVNAKLWSVIEYDHRERLLEAIELSDQNSHTNRVKE